MKKIYFVQAGVHWPVGTGGAVVVAKDLKEVLQLIKPLDLVRVSDPIVIGTSSRKSGVIFYNNGNY